MIVCACQGRDSTEGSVSDLKQWDFLFFSELIGTRRSTSLLCSASLPHGFLCHQASLWRPNLSCTQSSLCFAPVERPWVKAFPRSPRGKSAWVLTGSIWEKKLLFGLDLPKFLLFSIHCHYTYFCTSASKITNKTFTMSSKCIYNWKCCYCPAHYKADFCSESRFWAGVWNHMLHGLAEASSDSAFVLHWVSVQRSLDFKWNYNLRSVKRARGNSLL